MIPIFSETVNSFSGKLTFMVKMMARSTLTSRLRTETRITQDPKPTGCPRLKEPRLRDLQRLANGTYLHPADYAEARHLPSLPSV